MWGARTRFQPDLVALDDLPAEIARVLRPGGTMLVSDIVAESIPAEIAANREAWIERWTEIVTG